MRYNTVLFDADGTLLDFSRSEREALCDMLRSYGIEASDEQLAAYSEINDSLWKKLERKEIERSVLTYRRFELFFEKFGYSVDAKKAAAEYLDIISTKGYMLEGALELLESLYGKIRMYIVTNGAAKVQKGRWERTGLDRYFDGVFISEIVGFNKPDVRYFECVESSIENFDKQKTIVVGDSLSSDIKGGCDFGVDTCWYAPNLKDGCGSDMPTYTVTNYKDMIDIILG